MLTIIWQSQFKRDFKIATKRWQRARSAVTSVPTGPGSVCMCLKTAVGFWDFKWLQIFSQSYWVPPGISAIWKNSKIPYVGIAASSKQHDTINQIFNRFILTFLFVLYAFWNKLYPLYLISLHNYIFNWTTKKLIFSRQQRYIRNTPCIEQRY